MSEILDVSDEAGEERCGGAWAGYGMPLVKAYVTKLGGDIELTSDASGTVVTIHLPRCGDPVHDAHLQTV